MSYSIMFTIHSWMIILPLFTLATLCLFFSEKVRQKRFTVVQCGVIISFMIYIMGVIHFVLFPIDVNIGQYANQTPWWKTLNYIPILTISIDTFILNIIMLVPFGMFLPFLTSHVQTVKKAIKYGFLFSLSIEMTQLLVRITLGHGRGTDINDLLANTLGALIGYMIIKAVVNISFLERASNALRIYRRKEKSSENHHPETLFIPIKRRS